MKYKQEKEHKDTRRKKQQIEIKIFPIIVILVMVVITVFLVIGRKQERMRASIVGKQRYATSNNSHAEIDSTQESCIITYEYIDTTGDGRYNICKVTVRTKESWYFNNVPSDWEQKSDQEIEKIFIENENITIQCIYASEPIRINPSKIGSYSIPVTGIHMDKSIATITIGDTLTLKATVTPEDAINKKIIWTSSNESVATVDQNGAITTNEPGKTIITVITEDGGKTATCEVNVEPHHMKEEQDSTQPSCIVIYEYMDTTGEGKFNICKVTVRTKESWYFNNVPSDWEQKSDQEIEKIFIENENITIQCIYASEPIRINPSKIGSYSIPVTGIHMDKSIATITIGDTLTLKATVTPEDAINKKIIWTSSNESIATVNGHGVVTAKAQGKASITAKTEDGEKTTKCEVTVVDKIDKPIEPDEPTEPSQPIEPDEPTEPNNPVGPNEPIDPNDPISPDRPSDIDNSSNFGDLIGGSQSNKRNDSEETKWATNKDKNEYFYSPTKLPSTGNRKIGRMFIMLLGVLTVMVTFIKYKTYKIK